MLTAIKSLFYIILAIFGLTLSLLIGLILLIRGALKKPLAEYAGTNIPRNMMITGTVMVSLPFIVILILSIWGITSSATVLYDRANYECIPDVWRHETVSQQRAEDDILSALLNSADNGNRESFAKNFTPELQKKKGFDKAVDAFFRTYPVGLSKCSKLDMTRRESGVETFGDSFNTDSLYFRCELDGESYFVSVAYCYCNEDEPDAVGVTEFRVMNLQAAAVYFENEDANSKQSFPVCDIRSSSDINARLVAGRAYLWTDTDTPRLSEEQLRVILKKTDRLDDPILIYSLGEPNLVIKESDSSEYGYFFELTGESGEPRYAYIQTDSERGGILWALLCTPYKIDYSKTFVEYKDNN